MAELLTTPAPARRTGEDGVSLLTAMVIALTVFAIGGIWTSLATHQYSQSARERHRDQARNAAEAGINEAMSRLSADGGFSTSELATLPGNAGEYEVSVTTRPSDPALRLIDATGYAPTKATAGRVARRILQQVDLISTNEFRYALFTAPGGVAGANNMAVNGDVYSADDLTLANKGTVSGSVTSLGSVTTVNNSTIGGDIRAQGNVIINNASTTVLGNVYSGGNVTITGRVRGNVQAAGSITGTGTVDGSKAQYSPPPPVPAQTVPTFTWNAAQYGSPPNLADHPPERELTPAEFQALWAANKGAFHGHYRIRCAVPCSTPISLDAKWTMSGDVTIVSDGPIHVSREVDNGAGGSALTLTIVSLSPASPAVLMSNSISPPDSIRIALFTPNGPVSFTNRKSFSGAVYAKAMNLEQQFTLTFVPVVIKGFTWDLASSTHFIIQSRVFREVPVS